MSLRLGFVDLISRSFQNAKRHENCPGTAQKVSLYLSITLIKPFSLLIARLFSYKHAVDGLFQVARHEGVGSLFNGVSMTATRAAFMTFGQLAFYDTFKKLLLSTGVFHDNPITHFSASIGAAGIATCMTQPFDVMKTRLMNAPPGTYSVGLFLLLQSTSTCGLVSCVRFS